MRLHDATETGCTGSESVLQSTPGGPHLPPGPLPLPRCGRGRGRLCLLTLPSDPLPFSHREWQREGSIAVLILRLRLSTILSPLTSSPLSRSSDHPSRTSTPWGLILSPLTSSPLSRSAGEGLGVRAPHAFPPAPCRSPTGRGGRRGGTNECWTPLTQWSHGFGACLMNEKAGCLFRLLGRGGAAAPHHYSGSNRDRNG